MGRQGLPIPLWQDGTIAGQRLGRNCRNRIFRLGLGALRRSDELSPRSQKADLLGLWQKSVHEAPLPIALSILLGGPFLPHGRPRLLRPSLQSYRYRLREKWQSELHHKNPGYKRWQHSRRWEQRCLFKIVRSICQSWSVPYSS
jgi:hypothetical protein